MPIFWRTWEWINKCQSCGIFWDFWYKHLASLVCIDCSKYFLFLFLLIIHVLAFFFWFIWFRKAVANALASAPSMWTLGNAGMGALQVILALVNVSDHYSLKWWRNLTFRVSYAETCRGQQPRNCCCGIQDNVWAEETMGNWGGRQLEVYDEPKHYWRRKSRS